MLNANDMSHFLPHFKFCQVQHVFVKLLSYGMMSSLKAQGYFAAQAVFNRNLRFSMCLKN